MTTPPQPDHAIGIDLGTSNTVAVIHSPDGRTRPLLFDGQPIMPSVVFLDEAGSIHVGRDAQRMAQLDPARCEPNPKRRIDEPSILLGDREMPMVRLLAAILRAIADKAVETVGFLPPAAITHPAAWGSVRRGVLTEAVRLAGWPPVRLVPEPIAAARYFAQVMRRPVPVGSSIAVFDFGGGTLDVAVVRNDGTGFTVIGSGGDESLGGLDLDSALVNHLGELIGSRHREIWAHLSRPVSTADRRYRRLFWEDVRGAKEMLSRTATAPIPVPGVDQAVHLTREELERLVGPLLERAARVTENTVAQAGLRPDALSGLFLVGGSSRVPLASRLLHSRLGIAPTVLEQPELPVAEGALAELVGPGEATAPTPVDPMATALVPPLVDAPSLGGPPPPAAPTSPAAQHLPAPPSPAKPWYRRRPLWIAAGAAALVLAVLAGILIFYPRYDQQPFTALRSLKTYSYPGDDSNTGDSTAFTAVGADTVYTGAKDGSNMKITAYALDGLKETAHATVGTSDKWDSVSLAGDYLVVRAASNDSSSDAAPVWVLDRKTLKQTWKSQAGGDSAKDWFVDGGIGYLFDHGSGDENAYDVKTGKKLWHQKRGDKGAFLTEDTWDDYSSGPSDFGGVRNAYANSEDTDVVVDTNGGVTVLTASTGKTKKSKGNRVDPSGQLKAYAGMLFATSGDATSDGYSFQAIDLTSLNPVGASWKSDDKDRKAKSIQVCGEDLVCVVDQKSNDDKSTRIVAFGTDGGYKWTKNAPGADHATPVGDRVVVSGKPDSGGKATTTIYDEDGNTVGKPVDGSAAAVDNGSVLTEPGVEPSGSGGTTNSNPAGVGAQDGQLTQLGPLAADITKCHWNDKYLACAEDKKFEIFTFRS